MTKLPAQSEAAQLGDHARHLDAGRSAPTSTKVRSPTPRRRWLAPAASNADDARAHGGRLAESSYRRPARHLVVSEIALAGAGRDHEMVVRGNVPAPRAAPRGGRRRRQSPRPSAPWYSTGAPAPDGSAPRSRPATGSPRRPDEGGWKRWWFVRSTIVTSTGATHDCGRQPPNPPPTTTTRGARGSLPFLQPRDVVRVSIGGTPAKTCSIAPSWTISVKRFIRVSGDFEGRKCHGAGQRHVLAQDLERQAAARGLALIFEVALSPNTRAKCGQLGVVVAKAGLRAAPRSRSQVPARGRIADRHAGA